MQNTSIQMRLPAPMAKSQAKGRPTIESTARAEGAPSRHFRKEDRSARRATRQRSIRSSEHPALFDARDVLPLQNRIRYIAPHAVWFGFRTQARLARDSGVSRAAVSRLIRHEVQPSLSVALRVTKALSVRLGRSLDVWEVFSLDGTYPTASVCELCGCRSCSLGTEALAESEKGYRKGGA